MRIMSLGHAPDGVETVGRGLMDAVAKSRLIVVPPAGDGASVHRVWRMVDIVAVDPLASRQDWFHAGQYAADGAAVALWSEGLSAFIGLNLFFRYESGVNYFRATRAEDFLVIAAGRILDQRRTGGRGPESVSAPWSHVLCVDSRDGRTAGRWLRVGGMALQNFKGRGWSLTANKIDVPTGTMLAILREAGVRAKPKPVQRDDVWWIDLTDHQAAQVRLKCKVMPRGQMVRGGTARKDSKGFQKRD